MSPKFLRVAPLAALFALAACGDDPVSADDRAAELVTADVAASAGEAIANDVLLLVSAEHDAMGGMPMSPGADTPNPPERCTRRQDGAFECSDRAQGSMSWTHTFWFYDGETLQDGYDALTTDSIVTLTTVTGSHSRGGYSAQFSHERNATLSGLDGEETQRTWNGAGSTQRAESFTGPRGTRQYQMASQDSVKNVVVALPRETNPYPVSGQIVHRVQANGSFSGAAGDGSRSFSRRVQVTFNGTAIVPLLVNDVECELNLEARTVTCPTA